MKKLKEKYAPKCEMNVFRHWIFKSIKYLRPNAKFYKNLSVSLNLGDNISLKTLGDTPKSLYCSVCYLYDCGKHHIEGKCLDERHHYYNYDKKIPQD